MTDTLINKYTEISSPEVEETGNRSTYLAEEWIVQANGCVESVVT